ncbi:MAG: hypothetical protein IPP38_17405 [Bacteroidetes bacterium]|nr:hypothetical protein [Bacteroidota bacterium]
MNVKKNEMECEIHGLILIFISQKPLFLVLKMMVEDKDCQIRFGTASIMAVNNRFLMSCA